MSEFNPNIPQQPYTHTHKMKKEEKKGEREEKGERMGREEEGEREKK